MDFNRIRNWISRNFAAVVGIVGVILVTGFLLQQVTGEHKDPHGTVVTGVLQTAQGEHKCFSLPDQSEACLNTNTVVRYAHSADARNNELVSGEATFKIRRHDPRPFAVLSGSFLIRDVATQFNVYRKDDSTWLTVVDGLVKVTLARLDEPARSAFKSGSAEPDWTASQEYHRLQQVEFDESTGRLYEHPALTEQDLSQLLAWHRGRIDLNNRTLSNALAEFSRYQRIDAISIRDPSLRNLHLGGELDTSSLKDFLQYLTKEHDVRAQLLTAADGKKTVTLSRQHLKGD